MVVKFSKVKVNFDKRRVIKVMDKASEEAIRDVALSVKDTMKESLTPHTQIKTIRINGRKIEVLKPSAPGSPPHTKGLLQQAIDYEQALDGQSAIIGPRSEVVSNVGSAHEFGGSYRGRVYPKRPFALPALIKEVKNSLPKHWQNTVRS